MTNNNKEIYPSETKQEKSNNQVERNTIMNLASNLLNKDESSIDMGSIMKMATNLFKDDTLMNSVKDLAKLNQNKTLDISERPQKQEEKDTTLYYQHIQVIIHKLTELKQELQDIKKQNEHLTEIILNQEKQQTEKDTKKSIMIKHIISRLKNKKSSS
ncbi:hypothetical protein [Priestia megaterium]|uniref:hypothetical protein n=1 Tax=Priestia megaterium TaxID=1404 RepID=UPI0021F4900E|nr:hypothetical protein [Priestia megaterium]UYP07479.1 hypothetical protein OIJ04_25685 [Priestia megaterium]